MKDWENAALKFNRTSSAPMQEEVHVPVLISRSPKEVRDVFTCASAEGYGEVGSCATVAL